MKDFIELLFSISSDGTAWMEESRFGPKREASLLGGAMVLMVFTVSSHPQDRCHFFRGCLAVWGSPARLLGSSSSDTSSLTR